MEASTMKTRRAFTLIEMVAVLAIGGLLSGIAVFMLISLLKSHNTGREYMAYCRTINRLAEQFRADVHAAQKTSSDNDGAIFDLPSDSANIKIRYQCLPDRIDRSELQGEKMVRLESYILPPDMEVSIKIQPDKGAELACLSISAKQQKEKLYFSAPVRIEAVLGLNSRLSKVQTTKKEEPEKSDVEEQAKPATEEPAKSNAEQPATEAKP
jgi:prepilin-type N-terminal cleavage/methylation domain-containing protein